MSLFRYMPTFQSAAQQAFVMVDGKKEYLPDPFVALMEDRDKQLEDFLSNLGPSNPKLGATLQMGTVESWMSPGAVLGLFAESPPGWFGASTVLDFTAYLQAATYAVVATMLPFSAGTASATFSGIFTNLDPATVVAGTPSYVWASDSEASVTPGGPGTLGAWSTVGGSGADVAAAAGGFVVATPGFYSVQLAGTWSGSGLVA